MKRTIGVVVVLVFVVFIALMTPELHAVAVEHLLQDPLTSSEIIPVEDRAVEPGIVPRILPWIVSSLLLSAFVTFLLLRRKPKR
ncbi:MULTISPECIES: hypothetical protein [unclassified Exiguobacterium]|uniref:hypothetical protein n=1 Tax=unclassified Exiguobacterium TaxID=2644629 RepID=UPI000B595A1C|nr:MULTISPECIES: hypothetical protein [unclassified Exiguobacterium]ASI34304.1 hypothetical protein A0126_01485 [Exiguobacterium sp. N4-1P]